MAVLSTAIVVLWGAIVDERRDVDVYSNVWMAERYLSGKVLNTSRL